MTELEARPALQAQVSGVAPASSLARFSGTLATNVAITLLTVCGGVVAARLLGPAGRGTVAAIQAIPSFVGALFLCGVPASVSYYAARLPDNARQVVASAVAVTLLLAIPGVALAALVVSGLASEQSPTVTRGALVYLVFLPLQAIQFPALSALWGLERFGAWNALRIAAPAGWVACLLAAAAMERQDPVFLCTAYLCLYGLTIPGALYVLARCTAGPVRATVAHARALLAYGLPGVLATVPAALNARIDQAWMALAVPAAELGRYAVAVSYSAALSPALAAISAVVFPRIARNAVDVQVIARAVRVAALCAIAGAIPLALLAEWVLPAAFGDSFRGGVRAAVVLCGAGAVAAVNSVLEDIARALGAVRWPMYAQCAGVPVTVVALTMMLGRFGAEGAAWASLIAYTVTLCVLVFGVSRVAKLSIACLLVPTAGDARFVTGTVVAAWRLCCSRLPRSA